MQGDRVACARNVGCVESFMTVCFVLTLKWHRVGLAAHKKACRCGILLRVLGVMVLLVVCFACGGALLFIFVKEHGDQLGRGLRGRGRPCKKRKEHS